MAGKKVLLTGGRAPAVLDMARQINEFGNTVYVAETTHMHFCKSSFAVERSFKVPNPSTAESDYINALIDICHRESIDILIPNYLEIYPISRAKERFPEHTLVFCDDIKIIDTLNNKRKFFDLCQKIDVKTPHTVIIKDKDEYLSDAKSNRLQYPHVLKSFYCAGGMKTLTIRTKEEALSQPLIAPFLLQEYIDGKVWSTYGVAHEGKLTCHASYYPFYTFRENGGAICFQAHEHPQLLGLIQKIVSELRFTGQLGFDVMEKADGTLWAIECNPRITSGVHLMRGNVNLLGKITDPRSCFEIVDKTAPIQLTLMSMLGVVFSQKHSDFKTWLYYFLSSRDVLFNWNDPCPALCLPLIGMQFMKEYYINHKRPEEHIFLEVDYEVDDQSLQ